MEIRLDVLSIITVLLVIAKIFGYIDLAWVWVFAPLWIPLALFCVCMALTLIAMAVVAIIGFIANLFY